MAEDLRMALQELLRKAEVDGDIDFLREGVRLLAQELMVALETRQNHPQPSTPLGKASKATTVSPSSNTLHARRDSAKSSAIR
jgi:hypothetical protein